MQSEVDSLRGSITPLEVEEEISLLDLAITAVRYRRRILRTTLIVIVAGAMYAWLLPARYTATTAILPPQQGGSMGSALMSQLGSLSSMASLAGGGALGALKNPNDLQVAMLKSRTVEDAMIDRFHLLELYGKHRKSDARKKLEHVVSIENGAKDGLSRISVTDHDPVRAAAMANGYVEEFKRASSHLAVTEASQRRLFFEQQLSGAKDDLAGAEEALKSTEQRTGLIQLDSQDRAVISSVAQLRAQVAAKEVQIRGMQSFATEQNPDLQMAQQELAGLRSQLDRTGSASDELLIPKGNMQEAGLEYVRKLRDVKYYETIFELLARQYEVAKVDEARQGAIVQVVDAAVVPDRRSWPKPLWILPGAAVLGLMLGLFLAFAGEAFNRVQQNPAEQSRLAMLKMMMSSPSKQGSSQ